MVVSVALRGSQINPLSQPQLDGNFQGLADGVNANATGVVAANAAIAAQNVTIGNLGTQISNIAANQISPAQEIFIVGTDGGDHTFSPGTSTTITTSKDYGTVNNIKIYFGASRQFNNEVLSYINKVITFKSVIPVGIDQIAVDGGLAPVLPTPPSGSVGVGQLASDTLAYFAQSAFSQSTSYPAGTLGAKARDTISIKDAPFNALPTKTDAQNKTALQAAITVYAALGATIIIPADISIGHKVTDKTTWPNFTGVTKTITVIDYGPGQSYAGYPAAYDGEQIRKWLFTPQTTTPGNHDGNTIWQRAAWAPNYCISNDMDLSGTRLASDNRRAFFTIFVNGNATYAIGQGTQAGAGFTDEQLSNFMIQKYAAPGDTLGAYTPYLVERQTGRVAYGVGTNAPQAAHHFGPVNASETLTSMLVQHSSATAYVQTLSNANGVSGSVQKLISTTGSGTGWNFTDCYANAGSDLRLRIQGNGNVINANNSYGAISDLRLKENIAPARSYLADLLRVEIVKFSMISEKSDKATQLGVIAQKLAEIFPGMVDETEDFEEVTKTRQVTRSRQVVITEIVDVCRNEIVDIDGKWTERTVIEPSEIKEPQFDDHLLFDEAGQPIMEIDIPDHEDENGQTVLATLKQKVHRAPVMEDYTEDEVYVERVSLGTFTKHVKYSVFVPMLITAVQALECEIAALKAGNSPMKSIQN